MAKKRTPHIERHSHLIFPALIGAGITYLFSHNINLAVTVFVAVLVGNWIGYAMKSK